LSGLVPVRPSGSAASRDNPNDKSAAEKAKDAKPKKAEPKTSKPNTAKGDQLYRWYEIKPNDTMGTIARKELGASEHWQEIKKLNSGIDPQKMKPGERIRLPRKPVSASSPQRRASA
jgi:LysM repeat protein